MAVEDRRVDHLILLVGGNPLPNAVVAKMLATPGTVVSLIHSEDTQAIASRLQEWLNGQGLKNIVLKLTHESGPGSIFRRAQESLGEVLAHMPTVTPRIVLNYTGGTKAMAVHAYRAVDEWARGSQAARTRGIHPEYCYLDVRSDTLVWDPTRSDDRVREEYVGNRIRLKLADMLALHNWHVANTPRTAAVLPHTALILAQMYSKQVTAKAYIAWKHDVLKCCHKDSGRWKDPEDLKKTRVDWPSDPQLEQFMLSLKAELAQTVDEKLDIGRATATSGLGEPREFCLWLHGKWLEHLVLNALAGLRDGSQLDECMQNVETQEVLFDVDDVAVRDHQLFALTCSTDTDTDSDQDKGGRARLKLKLFEALIRARQIGGDAARVALVCCADDPDGLLAEVRRDLDPEQRCRVFGRRQLIDLAAELEVWFETRKGG